MVKRRRRLLWAAVIVLGVLFVLAVVGPFVYIHFIEGPAPPKLALPDAGHATPTTSRSGGPSDGSAASVSGEWNVGPGSVVGYRVQEVLIGQNSTAVGRTTKVWGTMTVDGTSVTKVSVTADMASVESDQSERNARFDGSIMDVARYPTATLTLSHPINLGSIPAAGTVAHYSAAASLTMHGVTKTVMFPVSAERVHDGIDVLADITIPFAEWNISNPSVGGFVTTANNGTLEVLLHFTQGPGNPPSTSSGPSNPGGAGGPPTVPKTTVPPLTVPSS